MKIIDAKELGLKILRFDVQKYPNALLQAAERLRLAQDVIFTNLPRVKLVSDKTAGDWLGTNSA